MATPSQSDPDNPAPMFSQFPPPIAYQRSFPPIAYAPHFPSLLPHHEIDHGMFPVPLPTSPSDETCLPGPSTISPTRYSSSIASRTSLEPQLPSPEEDTNDSPVYLTDVELWRLFHGAKNEMIVTKPGR